MKLEFTAVAVLLVLTAAPVRGQEAPPPTPEKPCETEFAQRPGGRDGISTYPRVENTDSVRSVFHRTYDALGVSGVERGPVLWVLVTGAGDVERAVLHNSSGSVDADSAAFHAVRRIRFTPALQGERQVCSWLALPTPGPSRSQ